MIRNTMKMETLAKLTKLGQLNSVMEKVLEKWSKCCGQYVEPDERTKMVSELNDAFTVIGVGITTSEPFVGVAAGIISAGYKARNISLYIRNEEILKGRIEEKFPGYFDPSSDYNRQKFGGGGGGGGY